MNVSKELCNYFINDKIEINRYKKLNIFIKNNKINRNKKINRMIIKINDKKKIYEIEKIIKCGIRFYNYINNYIFTIKNLYLDENENVDVFCDYKYIKFLFPNKSIIRNIGNYENAKKITTLYKTNECIICYEDLDICYEDDDDDNDDDNDSVNIISKNKNKNNKKIKKNKLAILKVKQFLRKISINRNITKNKNKCKLKREINYFKCGHGFCNKCCDKLMECPLCKQETEKEHFIIYIKNDDLINFVKEIDYKKYNKI